MSAVPDCDIEANVFMPYLGRWSRAIGILRPSSTRPVAMGRHAIKNEMRRPRRGCGPLTIAEPPSA